MPKGIIKTDKEIEKENFRLKQIKKAQEIDPLKDLTLVDDTKLKMSLIAMSSKYNDQIRAYIYSVYNDLDLMRTYNAIRESSAFEHGGKSKVHRKVVEFPNGFVFDFVDTVLTPLYGQDWLQNKKALRHELVRPWWVVKKL